MANGGSSPVSPGAGLDDPSVYFDAAEDHGTGDPKPRSLSSHVNSNVRGSPDTAHQVCSQFSEAYLTIFFFPPVTEYLIIFV